MTQTLNQESKQAQFREEPINGELYSIQVTLRRDDVDFDPPQRITTEEDLNEINRESNESGCALFCAPIAKGDLRNSILTFLTASVGAGILSLPQVLSFYGLIMGIFFFVAFALINYETYRLVDLSIEKSGCRGYGNICSYFFGKRLGKFFNVGMIGVLFMISCIYASITWNFLEKVLTDYKVVSLPVKDQSSGQFDEYSSEAYTLRLICMTIIGALCFPLLLFRRLTALKYITVGIMAVIAYIFLLTLLQTPAYYAHYRHKDSYQFDILPPAISLDWVSGIGALSMSFSCQPIYIYIRGDFIHKTAARTKKIYRYGLAIEFAIYMTFAFCGYLSLGKNNLPTIFTQRLSIFTHDYFMEAARLAFLPLIALHVLIPFITMREMVILHLKVKRTRRTVFATSIILTAMVFMLPVVYPDVLALMGIFGGLFSGLFGCIVFFLIGYQLETSLASRVKYFAFIVIFVWSALANTVNGVVGVFFS